MCVAHCSPTTSSTHSPPPTISPYVKINWSCAVLWGFAELTNAEWRRTTTGDNDNYQKSRMTNFLCPTSSYRRQKIMFGGGGCFTFYKHAEPFLWAPHHHHLWNDNVQCTQCLLFLRFTFNWHLSQHNESLICNMATFHISCLVKLMPRVFVLKQGRSFVFGFVSQNQVKLSSCKLYLRLFGLFLKTLNLFNYPNVFG